jgi:hypothetical protein
MVSPLDSTVVGDLLGYPIGFIAGRVFITSYFYVALRLVLLYSAFKVRIVYILLTYR